MSRGTADSSREDFLPSRIKREPNTQYVLSLSYGKDSLACLGAIEKLGLPLDRIIHAEVWATDDIPADLPPMVEFKSKADEIIKERYGIDVEHVYAIDKKAIIDEIVVGGNANIRETILLYTKES